MAMRDFSDKNGNRWTVWSTIPAWRAGVPEELQSGWLTFESGGLRKRLAPIPSGWEEAPVAHLQLYCSAAETLSPQRRSNPQDANAGQASEP